LAEQRGWGDYLHLILKLDRYEKAAELRLKQKIRTWSCSQFSQEELQAILES
jgi:hypothetical protein